MRKCFFGLFIAVWAWSVGVCGAEVVVTAEDGVTLDAETLAAYDLSPVTEVDHGLYVAALDEEETTALAAEDGVAEVAEVCRYALADSPNDPLYVVGRQWGHDAVKAAAARDIWAGKGHVRPTVVVIDTGYTFSHPDAGKVRGGKNYISGDNVVKDPYTHGTQCAGVIGAGRNNEVGIAGLFPDADIVVLSIFEADAKGEILAVDGLIAAAIYDAVDVYHADVISMSFGGERSDIVAAACKYAADRGVVQVAAVGNFGNEGSPLQYPAAFADVVGVANMDKSFKIDATSCKNSSVTVAAPGTAIATLVNPDFVLPRGALYADSSGTSLATPFVAALGAYAKALAPSLNGSRFTEYLKTTAVDIEKSGYDIRSGYGLTDFNALLNAVAAKETVYAIASEADFNAFAAAVNGGKGNVSAFLTADVALSGSAAAINGEFRGVFNGDGHRLSGLKRPLFATIAAGSSVKNVAVSGDVSGGGLIAVTNNGSIVNCTTAGSVNGAEAGGVCRENNGDIMGCLNGAVVSGDTVGGIAAYGPKGKIVACANVAAVSSHQRRAAGICAVAGKDSYLLRCYNVGDVADTTAWGNITLEKTATIEGCFYSKDGVVGSSDDTIMAKDSDFMTKNGFLLMLNGPRQYFVSDGKKVNGGYPLPGDTAALNWFSDVPAASWYADAVYGLAGDSIVAGRGNHRYVPAATVTRAEFVTILGRLYGIDAKKYGGASAFSDVKANTWYTAAVNWAADAGIAAGRSKTRFCPNDNVTREEICCFLGRYLRKYGHFPTDATTGSFSDTNAISAWAAADVDAMAALGVINGFPDGTFRPRTAATRAQTAVMDEAFRRLK